MNRQLWFLAIVTPIWFIMHMVIQGGGTGLEAYDTHLLLILFVVMGTGLLSTGDIDGARKAPFMNETETRERPYKLYMALQHGEYPELHGRAGYVYLLRSISGYYKIGRTQKPADRLRTFEVKLPFEVEFVHIIICEDMYEVERDLHDQYADKRVNGEWFALSPRDVFQICKIQRQEKRYVIKVQPE